MAISPVYGYSYPVYEVTAQFGPPTDDGYGVFTFALVSAGLVGGFGDANDTGLIDAIVSYLQDLTDYVSNGQTYTACHSVTVRETSSSQEYIVNWTHP